MTPRPGLSCLLATLLLLAALAARAATTVFAIPSQPLHSALLQFSLQSGLQVFYPSELAAGRQATAVEGELEVESALRRLLAGSGLDYRFSDPDTVVLFTRVSAETTTAGDTLLREELIVTGSHIRRDDQLRSPSPITSLDRSDLLQQGNIELPKLLQDLPFSSGAEVQVHNLDQPLTAGTGAINLRNLGLGATMVLLDGFRQTHAAVATTEGETFVDLNTLLPVIMIERIEILRDGASATYGSDAVAGVINIIPRNDYQGIGLEGRYQSTGDSDQADARLSAIFGTALGTSGGHFTTALSYLDRQRLATVDRDFTSGTVISSFGQPGTYLGSGGFTRDPACGSAAGIIGDSGFCQFDASPYFDLVPDEERLQWYNHLRLPLGNSSRLEARLGFNDADVWVTASPSFPFATDLPQVPSHNPGNSFGEPLLFYGRVKGAEHGASRSQSQYEHGFAALGISSDYQVFTVDADLAYSRNKVRYGRVDTVRDRLQLALDGAGGEAGNQYWNPLYGSVNDPQLINGLFSDWGMRGETDLYTADIVASTDWFALADWRYAFALGWHYRREQFEQGFAREYNDKQFLALGGGPDFSAERDITAAFGELHVAFSEQLEMQLAGRYENYDRELDSLSPKVALRWQLGQRSALRASYSRAFRAPSLFQSGSSQSTPRAVSDDLVPGTPVFTNVITQGNPQLDPEEADVFNLGATLGDNSSLQLDLDLWYYDYRDVILKEDPQAIIERADNGDQEAADKIIRDPDSGHILQINADYINAASLETAGLDLGASYPFALAGGSARVGTAWTWTERFDIRESPGSSRRDGVGSRNATTPAARTLPQWKGNLWFNWLRGRHRAGLRISYVDSYQDDANNNAPVDSYSTLDLHYGLDGLFRISGLKASLGLLNALDQEPPALDAFLGYDAKTHDPRGRLWYLQLGYDI